MHVFLFCTCRMAPKFNYTEDQMKNALEAVANGMPISTASKLYNVPRITLMYKHKGKSPIERKMGPETILTKEEERQLVRWIFHVGDSGFPVTKVQLLDSVQVLLKNLKRTNCFNHGRPGRHWYESFLKRHPNIATRVSQNLTHSRATVTEEKIRKWFSEVKTYLTENNLLNILEEPQRVFNCDETAFFLSPKESKVLVRKGDKAIYNFINSDEKECITTLVTGNAAGILAPPMVMFSFQRIPKNIVQSIPEDWGLGKTDNGWMTGESFYEYITNIFHVWLLKNDIPLPVILYVDGHSSHITMPLSDFCTKNGIILVALYPNATHILQPMDVAIPSTQKLMETSCT